MNSKFFFTDLEIINEQSSVSNIKRNYSMQIIKEYQYS